MSQRTTGTRFTARALVVGALLSVGVLASPVVAAPTPAAENPQLDVRISRLTPAVLGTTGGSVTIAGVVHNRNRRSWSDAKVYVASPKTPFTSIRQARATIISGAGYTGQRLLDPHSIGDLGDLRSGQTRRFSITIPRAQLGLAGGDGVYPLSVQVLASDSGATAPLARATTFLPVRRRGAAAAPTTVLWPFLLPGTRHADGTYAGTEALATAIGPNGQLRNLLDLARTTPRRGSDVLLDPSLLAVVRDLARRPGTKPVDVSRRKAASDFLGDLTRLADRYSCSALGYDRPDDLGIVSAAESSEVDDMVTRATYWTLRQRNLSCNRVEWPTAHGATRSVLTALRRSGTNAVIVSPWVVPDWQSRAGDILARRTAAGTLPLVVDDPLTAGVPGVASVLTLRQQIVSEAVLDALAAGTDVQKTSTVILVNPKLNPGRVSGTPLKGAYESAFVDPVNFAASLRDRKTPYAGTVPELSDTKPISRRQVEAAEEAAQTAHLLDGMLLDPGDRTQHAQEVAALVSQRWRHNRSRGLDAARHANGEFSRELADISVEGPGALTLSSRSGRFPVTVRNQTPHRVRVGLGLDSSAAPVRFKAPTTVDIAAGESRTVTVDINMATQSATTVSVHLSAADGQPFGAATVFNVRSSRVGVALWVAIGVSMAFVALALIRRFARPGHRPEHPTIPPDDFDD